VVNDDLSLEASYRQGSGCILKNESSTWNVNIAPTAHSVACLASLFAESVILASLSFRIERIPLTTIFLLSSIIRTASRTIVDQVILFGTDIDHSLPVELLKEKQNDVDRRSAERNVFDPRTPVEHVSCPTFVVLEETSRAKLADTSSSFDPVRLPLSTIATRTG